MSQTLTVGEVPQMLASLFAPWVQELGLVILSLEPGHAVFRLPVSTLLCREGGSVCGQALMSAADTCMVFAISAQLGEFRAMTTVSMNASFLRPVTGHALITAKLLKPGKSLMFGQIEISSLDGKLCAQATTTYAML